jgi:two-component system response regulator YesN
MPRKQQANLLKQTRQMKAYVEKNYIRDLKLADLSKSFNYSQGHISRLFRDQLGIGFVECLTLARLRSAKRLLRRTRIPIYEIAGRSGFNFRDYFFKVFKKAEGITPREYRQIHLND